MDTKVLIELFGYLGSILVVISMLMTNVKRLRLLNMTGSVIFAIYALIIRSYPTAFMNFCLVAINVYRIYQLSRTEKHFDLIESDGSSGVIRYLLNHYHDDIAHFFPDLDPKNGIDCQTAYLVTCDATPAGLLLGNRTAADTIDVLLDYTTPAYRDCSVGAFLYEKLARLGLKRLVFRGSSVDHEAYLKKMGFTTTAEGYVKTL